MQLGLVIDVSCDLPHDYLVKHQIQVIPSALHLGKGREIFDREPNRAQQFYQERIKEATMLEAESSALSPDETEAFLMERVVPFCDNALVITLTSSRSKTFENVSAVAQKVLARSREVRGQRGPFHLRLFDSGSLFAGPGLLVYEILRLNRLGGREITALRKRLEEVSPHVYAYLITPDLGFIRSRAQKRQDKSIGGLSMMMAMAFDIKPIFVVNQKETRPVAKGRGFEGAVSRLFDHASAQIRQGLLINAVNISYAGPVQEITRLPVYKAFAAAAKTHGVDVMVSIMSCAAAVNVGAGALSLAYCTQKPIGWDG